jgi:hypothetical protein
MTLIWIMVAVAVASLIGLTIWQHFFPPPGSKISNKVILNRPPGINRTRTVEHLGQPIKEISSAVNKNWLI